MLINLFEGINNELKVLFYDYIKNSCSNNSLDTIF